MEPGYTFGTVTEKISAIVLTRPASNGWFVGFGVAFLMTMMMLYAIGFLFLKGIGIWGVTIPIGWGFAIVNFVWWIGIGHAGTLISAILLLLRQSWRNSINRFAEAMTLFAVACAGIFPAIHVGRPWLAYWLFPHSQHDGGVAAIPQPADVGRIRGFDLRHDFGAVLVHRSHPRPGHVARSRYASRDPHDLRHALDGLAGIGAPLAPLRNRVSASGRTGHAAGALGAHGGEFRFRSRHRSGLAYDNLPALLRCRRNLFRFRHGAHAGDSHPQDLRPRRFHHRTPFAERRQGHARHWIDRRLRLRH